MPTRAQRAADDALLAARRAGHPRAQRALPARPPGAARRASSLLHRERAFSETEQRWIGWERKRGKLEAAGRARWPTAARAAFLDLGEISRIAAGTALRRHARQRHPAAAGPPARAGGRGRAPAQPAAAGRQRRAAWSAATASCSRASSRRCRRRSELHALPLAVCRAVRHRPLQRGQLRGLPGPVRRRQLHRQGPAATCRRCTRCWPAACPKARC